MAWTSPRTWVAGETITASIMNTHVRDNLNYLNARPQLFTYQNTPQAALVTSTSTLITFDTNVTDNDPNGSMHSTTTNPSRIIPKTAGYHEIIWTVTFVSNATGGRQIDVRKNAAGNAAGGTRVNLVAQMAANGLVTVVQLTGVVQFNGSTDYVEVFGFQSSGANLALSSGSWIGAVGVQTLFLSA